MRSARYGDEDVAQLGRIVTKRTRIPHADSKPLAPPQHITSIHTTDRGFQRALHRVHRQPVPRARLAIHSHVEISSAHRAFGKHTARTLHRRQQRFDLTPDPVQCIEVWTEELDADGRLDPGRQHVEAVANRHRPHVGNARRLYARIRLADDRIVAHTGSPVTLFLQHRDRLNHRHRCHVGRRFGTPDLAQHSINLWNRRQRLITLTQHGLRLLAANTRKERWHIHDRPFMQRRHKLSAQQIPRQYRYDQDRSCHRDRGPPKAQHQRNQRTVRPHQQAIHGIRRFRSHALPNEESHHDWHERDRQQRRSRHRQRLCPCERLEQAAFLILERKDRDERNCDDQQGHKQCRSDFLGRCRHELPMWPAGLARSTRVRVALHVFVQILHHHDGRIDHGADRNRDAAQRHDVCRQPQGTHGKKCDTQSDRQRNDRHQRAVGVQQKNQCNNSDDHRLLDQLLAEGAHGARDQRRPIVPLHKSNPWRQGALHLTHPQLHTIDHVTGIGAIAHDNPAGDYFALATEVGDAAAKRRAFVHRCDIVKQHRHASHLHQCHMPQLVQ